MLKVGVGHREGIDTAQVLAAVIDDAQAQLGATPVAAVIVTIAGNFDPLVIARGLALQFVGLPIVGVTSSGDLSSRLGVSEDSIDLLLLGCEPGDGIRFSAGLGEQASHDPEAAARVAIGQAAPGPDTWLCFAFPDSRKPGTQALISALTACLPRTCALFGGKLTGQFDDDDAPRAQIFGARVVHDGLPVLLCGGAISYDFRVVQGWTPAGMPQVVTSADGQRVRRIGERSALEYYRHYFGAQARLLPEFALVVHTGDDGFYIRTPLRSDPGDTSDGTIVFAGEVPQGAVVQLSEAVREHLLASTELALVGLGEHAVAGPEVGAGRAAPTMRPAVVLVFSCASRKQILGTRIGLEVAAIERALPGVPVFGFYAGGELAPLVPGGEARLHNATMVTLVLGTCSEGQAPTMLAPARPEPGPMEPALIARKLRRAEAYRVRAEDIKEHSTAMLRTIGAEVDAARVQIAAQNDELRRLYADLEAEKHKSETLLQNILPVDVAEELKRTGQVKPVHYESVTVLFTDFKGFTRVASRVTPAALLRELDFYFSEFDRIIERHGLEKLKTIGDAYMCAGGIPLVNSSHPHDAVAAAWEIVRFMEEVRQDKLASGETPWELRVGVHTGPLMAGVIGQKKFAYDIWGDTVNIASRLESTGEAGRINLSRTTWEAIRERWACEHRGKLMAKNRGEIDMYFVVEPLIRPG